MSKKDRNSGMSPYPIYQNYGMTPMPNNNMGMMPMLNMMPNNIGMMPMPSNNMNGLESQINIINNQINNLEKRVARLEGSNTNNSGVKYNESNYYIV